MTNNIHAYAAAAPTAKMRRDLERLAADADSYSEMIAAMPEWAKAVAIDVRVPVSAKVAHDGLEVEQWTSKSGKQMHRVRWSDGTTTQYVGDLSKSYVEWNR